MVAIMPDDAKTSGASLVTVSSGGMKSKPVYMPAAPASPGIYSMNRLGFSQGYILNRDGTLNSPSNPASEGDPITIFATGVGPVTEVGPYAVTALAGSVFVDGFYARGIAAYLRRVPGLPGYVYEISVFVPRPSDFAARNPNLTDFKLPPQVPVMLVLGEVNRANPAWSAMRSQDGIALSVH